MDTFRAVDLTARLERLEKENRKLKRVVWAGAILSLVSAIALIETVIRPAFAQNTSLKTIQAYSYELLDPQGRVRASLGFTGRPTLSPWLTFNDPDGKTRLIIIADELGTSITAYSPDGGQFKSSLSAISGGAAVTASKEEGGRLEGSASISAYEESGSQMTVEDANGFTTAIGPFNIGAAKRQRSKWTNAASIVMFKRPANGQVIWQAPPSK